MSRFPEGFWRDPGHLLACGLGAGAAPFAPGTAGSLLAIPLYLMLAPLPLWAYVLVVILLFLIGIPLSTRAGRALGKSDHGAIVIDEIVGMLVTLALAPATPLALALGFGLFRLFDILKPWPIRSLERRVPGGLGVMLDDLVAGIFAFLLLQLSLWLTAGL